MLNQVADPFRIPPGTSLHIPVAWLRADPAAARVRSLRGGATVREVGAAGPGRPLTIGDWLATGDVVQTGDDSELVLEFVDGSSLLLEAGGELTLQQLWQYGSTGMANTRLHLRNGRLETSVEPRRGPATRFEITTPSAATAVRGTRLRVGADESRAESRTEVEHGKVEVSGGGSTTALPAGYGAITMAGHAPSPPIKLLDPPDIGGIPRRFGRPSIQFDIPRQPGAAGYRLQVSHSPNFEDMLFDRRFESGQVRGPDLPDGEYYLRVRGIDGKGLEGLNSARGFAIKTRPPAPMPLMPKPGAAAAEETPEMVWQYPETIGHYHLQIASDTQFDHLVVDESSLADAPPGGDDRGAAAGLRSWRLPLGLYFWRVASVDLAEGEGPFSDPRALRRVPPAPRVEEAVIGSESIGVRWGGVQGARQYQLQMAGEPSFSQLLIDVHTEKASLDIPSPEPGGYFLRVRAIDAEGFEGPFGLPQSIEVSHAP